MGKSLPRLTLFGRSVLLIACELVVNAVMWIVTGLLFGRDPQKKPILNLAFLAWTLGLKHATVSHLLSPDKFEPIFVHSAIDNATRGLINLGQLPVTCGLFFSLGHSTVVIVVNVAIAISTSVFNKLSNVGRVGGIVGSAVSGAFLFILGLANSIILWRIVRKRRLDKQTQDRDRDGTQTVEREPGDDRRTQRENQMLLMRIIGPIITFVDRPWKMFPVGLLFGFGFDTASSIAILAISAIAKRGSNGKGIPSADIVVLPLLFTAGMTMIDSVDSILMLYSYVAFAERSFKLFEYRHTSATDTADPALPTLPTDVPVEMTEMAAEKEAENTNTEMQVALRVKQNAMSGLSIILTAMSILVAFRRVSKLRSSTGILMYGGKSISLITIMGLIGNNCRRCQDAANAEDGGGLAGKWWRGWAKANDNSGYIGAAIVGGFVAVVCTWYGVRWIHRKRRSVVQERHQ